MTLNRQLVSDKDIKMLELLAQGASSKTIASSLGYKEGTMRVYLHMLYKRIGVKTKTTAVTCYLARAGGINSPAAREASAPGPKREESLGDLAYRTNLLAALGAMKVFIGSHGRLWEVTTRKGGGEIDVKLDTRRRTSRALWDALLAGDFAYAKQFFDKSEVPKLFIDSPSDCVVVASMLLIGGYSNAANHVMRHAIKRERGRLGITVTEQRMLRALRDAMDEGTDEGLALLHQLAADSGTPPSFRHCIMAALYYVYCARRDEIRAVAVADAVWAEAELVRESVEAMNEKPLPTNAALPAPAFTLDKAGLRAYIERIERA